METIKYIIITPVRNEEKYIHFTLESVIKQTIKPIEWIIVNDGSRDDTGNIIDFYASQHSWIKPLHLPDRGFRKSGGGVIEAFNQGYRLISNEKFDYIVKLDGDLLFLPTYFQSCFNAFENDPNLGLCGGVVVHQNGNMYAKEVQPQFHVRGATKIYRRDCWDAIGGLIEAPGWDTVDEVKANMFGWKTYSLDHLQLLHFRVTGSADGTLKSNVKYGYGSYISRYHVLFVLLKSIKLCFKKPPFLVGLAYLYGYLKGILSRPPQKISDNAFKSYVKKQQLKKIFQKKSIWN